MGRPGCLVLRTDAVEVESQPAGQKYVINRPLSCAVCAAKQAATKTFTRWGRKSCAGITGATLVYPGWMGGGHFGQRGSGSNHMCMHQVPEWQTGYFNDGNIDDTARVYRTEYETSVFGISSLKALHDHEAPCAVCQVTALDTLMIPGKRTCPSAYTKMYEVGEVHAYARVRVVQRW